jgi:hypothetical protein
MVGSASSIKRITTESRNSFKGLREVRKWLRQQVKRLLCCGVWRIGKAMEQVYQCSWRTCREINAFSSFEYQTFYVLSPCVTHLLTVICIVTDFIKASLVNGSVNMFQHTCHATIRWKCLFLLSAPHKSMSAVFSAWSVSRLCITGVCLQLRLD